MAVEGTGDGLHGDVAGVAGFEVAAGEHFALSFGLESAVIMLLQRHADVGLGGGGGGFDVDVEGAGGVHGFHSGLGDERAGQNW